MPGTLIQSARRWTAWQLEKVLPDPGVSFHRREVDHALLHEIHWRQDESVLDLGCYRGHYSCLLAERVRRVVGADLDLRALRQLSDRRVARIQCDAQVLPFADGGFDTVLCHNAVSLLPNPTQAAAEFARVCAPRGRVILSISNARVPYRRVNEFLERLWPNCPHATLPTPQNDWSVREWTIAFVRLGFRRERIFSCNLCWPLVHRVRGRWIIPNRMMWRWARTARRLSAVPPHTHRPHAGAHDYLMVFVGGGHGVAAT